MESIDSAELLDRLRRVSKTQFISITSITVPDMRVKGNPFAGSVKKISVVTGAINFRYTSVVNRQRLREKRRATFKARCRQWGQRIRDTSLIHHTNKIGAEHFYLDLKVQQRTDGFFHAVTRRRIQPAKLSRWIRRSSNPRQKLSREIILRDFRLDRIAELRIQGEVWCVSPAYEELRLFLPLKGCK